MGAADNGTSYDVLVARYNTDGTLDKGFGEGGAVTYNGTQNQDDEAFGVALQADGKILVTGHTNSFNPHYFLLLRYNPDGTGDNAFSMKGVVALFGENVGASVVVQPDTKIVIAGYNRDESLKAAV